jgi:Domain of unknown function (DUF397)
MRQADRVNLSKDHAWRASTACANGTCVEVAYVDGLVALRDSKDQLGPVLHFTASEWRSFVAGVRAGEFDLPND